jgi:hypothetical protein
MAFLSLDEPIGSDCEISFLFLLRGPKGFAEISLLAIRAELAASVEKSGDERI